jgi:hypothetical protein
VHKSDAQLGSWTRIRPSAPLLLLLLALLLLVLL